MKLSNKNNQPLFDLLGQQELLQAVFGFCTGHPKGQCFSKNNGPQAMQAAAARAVRQDIQIIIFSSLLQTLE